ncbi:MAG: CPBP family intramembrane glutamic endopeptidase [Bacilli bacterium]
MILLKNEIKTDFTIYKKIPNKIKSIFTGYLFILFGNYISQVILTLLGRGNQTSQNQESINNLLNSKYMIFMLLSILFIPIIEELIFRKSFFSLLNKFGFNKNLILIASSLAFGLIHVVFNLSIGYDELFLSIPYIVSGLVLGYIYIKSEENIYTVTIVHILNNLIASLLILFVI